VPHWTIMGIVSRLSTGKRRSLAGICIVCAKRRQFRARARINQLQQISKNATKKDAIDKKTRR
ncbi:hypothetical protein, partial [Alcanivorax sp.]|uniref:hypothetical protein n=1 Tax=Alcanivorax sp. TaxID=1872427 RepID=UPI00258F2B44